MKRGPNGSAAKRWPMSWPEEMHEEATAAAQEAGVSLAEWVRQLVARALVLRRHKQSKGETS